MLCLQPGLLLSLSEGGITLDWRFYLNGSKKKAPQNTSELPSSLPWSQVIPRVKQCEEFKDSLSGSDLKILFQNIDSFLNI